jgi:hypothetical protein
MRYTPLLRPILRAAPPLARHRPEWTEEATLTANYQANRFVLDPNEGFGRNQRPLPLKSKEEREAEDGGTYSDDDGEGGRWGCGFQSPGRGFHVAGCHLWLVVRRWPPETSAGCRPEQVMGGGPLMQLLHPAKQRRLAALPSWSQHATSQTPVWPRPRAARLHTEIRAATGLMRKAGKAPPKTLTTRQKQIVEKLLAAHGEDVQVRFAPTVVPAPMHPNAPACAGMHAPSMPSLRSTPHASPCLVPAPPATPPQAWFRDIKLNRMQHSEGKLRELLQSYKFHAHRPAGDRHEFRAPRKPPKRI